MSNATINGGSGNDTIFAGSGNDLVSGGIGNDTIFDGAGNDSVTGDYGDDTFWLASGSNDGEDDLDGGFGSDTLIEDLTAETPGSYTVTTDLTLGTHFLDAGANGVDTLAGIENYTLLGAFDATIIGNTLANTLTTGDGADSILGFSGHDILSSGGGNAA